MESKFEDATLTFATLAKVTSGLVKKKPDIMNQEFKEQFQCNSLSNGIKPNSTQSRSALIGSPSTTSSHKRNSNYRIATWRCHIYPLLF